MPRFILQADDGREIFSGEVSAALLERLGRLVRRHFPLLRAIADGRQALLAIEQARAEVGRKRVRR